MKELCSKAGQMLWTKDIENFYGLSVELVPILKLIRFDKCRNVHHHLVMDRDDSTDQGFLRMRSGPPKPSELASEFCVEN